MIRLLDPVLLLAFGSASFAQDEPRPTCPELVGPPRWGRVAAATSDGAHLVRLTGPEAWLVDGRDLSTRLVVRAAPAPIEPDRWRTARFSDDGARLVLMAMGGTCVWVDVAAAEVIAERRVTGPTENALGVTDAQAGRVALQAPRALTVLEALSGEELLRVEVSQLGAPCALTPGGTRVVYVGRKGLAAQALDGTGRRFEMNLDGPYIAIHALDEDRVLTLRRDGARVFSIRAREVLVEARWPEDEGWVFGGFSLDPPRLALQGPGDRLRVLDANDLTTAWELEGTRDVALEPTTGSLWADRTDGGGRRTTAHDLASGEERFELPDDLYSGIAPNLAPARDGRLWLTRGNELEFQRIDPYSGRLGDVRTPPAGDARFTGVLADGTVWVVGARGTLSTVDERTGEQLARIEVPQRAAAAVSGGRRILVRADGEAVVVEGADLRPRGRFPAGEWALLSPGGGRALVVCDGELRLVTTATGEILETLVTGLDHVRRLAWDGEGRTVAILDGKFRARLWRDGAELALESPFGSERSLAVAPDGRTLALGGGTDEGLHLRVFDATTGRLRTVLPIAGWWPFGGSVRVLHFDPAGEFLAATMGDCGAIQVHRAGTWDEFWAHDYGGGNPGAIQVAFDPAAGRLWSWGMTNETPAVHDLATGRIERRLAGTGLERFAAGGFDAEATTVAAIRAGTLVVLDADGTRRLEVLDLGDFGRVVADRSGELRGPDAALRQTFVRVAGRVRPALGAK